MSSLPSGVEKDKVPSTHLLEPDPSVRLERPEHDSDLHCGNASHSLPARRDEKSRRRPSSQTALFKVGHRTQNGEQFALHWQ